MAHPETGAVEVKGTMKVSQEDWDAIFGKKKPKEAANEDTEHTD